MNHVNRANQFRNELTISRFEQIQWTKRINEFDQYERIHRMKLSSINEKFQLSKSTCIYSKVDWKIFTKFKYHTSIVKMYQINLLWMKWLFDQWFRKRQTFIFKNVNIQHRSNRKTFNHCIICCDERTSNSIFDKFNIELTSLFYHIEC